MLFSGCAEQGQLGRIAECFSARGGRHGLGNLTANNYGFQVKSLYHFFNGKIAFFLQQ